MPRTSSVLLALVVLVLAAAAGASARRNRGRRGGGGVLDGGVGVLPPPLKPDVIVAKPGGRGDVTTIGDALLRASRDWNATGGRGGRHFVIHIREGVYDEHVVVDTPNVVLMGDGRDKTIITGFRCNKTNYDVHESATLTAKKDGFMARDLYIRNTAGLKDDHQAVALFSDSNRSIFLRCDIQGFQDTLLANTGLQFYRDCGIWGTVDFVFGNAAAVFQRCALYARSPADPSTQDVLTAQGREDHEGPTGFVFQECAVAPSALPGDGKLRPETHTYLGRAWKHHAKVVFIRCSIAPIVHANGWVSWNKHKKAGGLDPTPGHENHIYFAEYDNHVLGRKEPVTWQGFARITKEAANKFTPPRFFQEGDDWIRRTGVPYDAHAL